jgi:uncharacterized protein (DUF3084 family)
MLLQRTMAEQISRVRTQLASLQEQHTQLELRNASLQAENEQLLVCAVVSLV